MESLQLLDMVLVIISLLLLATVAYLLFWRINLRKKGVNISGVKKIYRALVLISFLPLPSAKRQTPCPKALVRRAYLKWGMSFCCSIPQLVLINLTEDLITNTPLLFGKEGKDKTTGFCQGRFNPSVRRWRPPSLDYGRSV